MLRLSILGTRGVPGRHGGFETFAERLALYLSGRGWEVTVYCQEYGAEPVARDFWQGVRRVRIPVARPGPPGTVAFDWRSTLLAAREGALVLTLGYNTAVFSALYRLRRVPNLINMDGMEWRRGKWSAAEKAWLYLNERCGCWFGNHLIADHPEIMAHLATRVRPAKITVVPYGADRIDGADPQLLRPYGLEPGRFALVIARPEPENSIREMVSAFSRRPRGRTLAVLGDYQPAANRYHRAVMEAAGPEVAFLGPLYEASAVSCLRNHCALYLHGHTVGGTNPSLVEALGAGSPVLAHDNRFNRWVAGPGARYFGDEDECASALDELLESPERLGGMRDASWRRHAEEFEWDRVLKAYERLLAAHAVGGRRHPQAGGSPSDATA